jgi:hypothetical protein
MAVAAMRPLRRWAADFAEVAKPYKTWKKQTDQVLIGRPAGGTRIVGISVALTNTTDDFVCCKCGLIRPTATLPAIALISHPPR